MSCVFSRSYGVFCFGRRALLVIRSLRDGTVRCVVFCFVFFMCFFLIYFVLWIIPTPFVVFLYPLSCVCVCVRVCISCYEGMRVFFRFDKVRKKTRIAFELSEAGFYNRSSTAEDRTRLIYTYWAYLRQNSVIFRNIRIPYPRYFTYVRF